MRYQSLLFPGVLILTITSLLIVQSCTKNDRADTENDRTGIKNDRTDTENNRVNTKRDRADSENDRANTKRDLELSYAHSQALHYLMGYYNTKYKARSRSIFTTCINN